MKRSSRGAVVRSNDHVRITAQLIDAASDRHLWAKNYTGDFRDVLSLQDGVAKQIATQVRVSLGEDQQEVFPRCKKAALKPLELDPDLGGSESLGRSKPHSDGGCKSRQIGKLDTW
ncbi:MAG: hypothetical protein ACJ74Z_21615 [Bryobacteraceae bacterium]